MQKNAIGLKSTWIKNLHIRPNTIQVFKEDIGPNFITLKLAMILGYDTKGTGNNKKNKQIEIHKNVLKCMYQNHYSQTKMATHRMGEDICQSCI